MDNIKTVQEIQNYIRENFKNSGFSVEKLCEFVGYSLKVYFAF